MKKIACIAVLLSSVLSANFAQANESDFTVRVGAGWPIADSNIGLTGTYNKGPIINKDGTDLDPGALISEIGTNKDLSYTQKLPQIFGEISVKFNPFFALDAAGGYSGRKETNITLEGAVNPATPPTPGDSVKIFPATTPKITPTLTNQGFFGRVGASVQWSNSSMFTPFAGGFIGMERSKFELTNLGDKYKDIKTDWSSKNYTFFGAKVGGNMIFTEGGLGLSVNYLYQRDMSDEAHKVTGFKFTDDAMNAASPPAASPNIFTIDPIDIKKKDKNKHAFEVALLQSF